MFNGLSKISGSARLGYGRSVNRRQAEFKHEGVEYSRSGVAQGDFTGLGSALSKHHSYHQNKTTPPATDIGKVTKENYKKKMTPPATDVGKGKLSSKNPYAIQN